VLPLQRCLLDRLAEKRLPFGSANEGGMPPLPGSIYGCRGTSARLSAKRGVHRPFAHLGAFRRHGNYRAQNGPVPALRMKSPPLVRGTARANVKGPFEQALGCSDTRRQEGDCRWVARRGGERMPARMLSARRAGISRLRRPLDLPETDGLRTAVAAEAERGAAWFPVPGGQPEPASPRERTRWSLPRRRR